MARITSIIDIGSNSMRMVVFKKTSRFAFHLISETKSKVKISQNAYLNNNNLQKEPMKRAFLALSSFINISKNLKARKILCVATSALRDAPNKKEFILKVKNELGLNIKIIDGSKEAYLGGIAANNLIHCKEDYFTLDIGGGSTELALKVNNDITNTVSLKIGTVRIQELYFDNNISGAKEYIINELKKIPSDFLQIDTIVGMGGTIRALSKSIMHTSKYPYEEVHGYTYNTESTNVLFKTIITSSDNKILKELGIKKERYDTIRVGTLIYLTILEYLAIKKVVTSGVGVREGLYLSDILRTSQHKFPANFNISIKSLLDRFSTDEKQTAYLGNNISKIFDVLKPLHKLHNKYKSHLVIAAKLQEIGISLNYYKNNTHGSNYILNGLSYGFSHENRILISKIIKYSKKDLPKKHNIEKYQDLLPSLLTIQWLSFIHNLNKTLNIEFSRSKNKYLLDENEFCILCNKENYIVKYELDKIKSPIDLKITLKMDLT